MAIARPNVAVHGAVALAVLGAASATASAAPEARSEVARTGWVAAPAGSELRTRLGGEASAAIVPGSALAARVEREARAPDGAAWLLVRYAGRDRRGWIPARKVRPVPAVRPLPAGTVRRLDALLSAAGPRSGAVVRDRAGRTLYAAGHRGPLILASLTKLFTVAAALDHLDLGPEARAILAPSDNARAQRLMNAIGGGRNARGVARTTRFAATLGARVRLRDGSGLDDRNRAAPGEVVDLLEAARDLPRFATLRAGLAAPGASGTLEGRLLEPSIRGRVRAKTGTLDPVSTLAGYLRPRGAGLGANRELTFAILMNHVRPPAARDLQDDMLRALVRGS